MYKSTSVQECDEKTFYQKVDDLELKRAKAKITTTLNEALLNNVVTDHE